LYDGGMQKMLTRAAGTGGPPTVTPVAGEPVSTIVRAVSSAVKAPGVRWPQLVKLVTVAQSAFDVHCTGRHGKPPHVLHGGPGLHVGHAAPEADPLQVWANWFEILLRQYPQKTFT